MPRLAIFDCDGTLVDSQANICRAMEDTFVARGIAPPSRAAIRHIVGLSPVEAIAALVPDAEDAFHRTLAGEYKATFFAMRTGGRLDAEPLFDGIADALDAFRDAGWTLGIATGKSDRGLAALLAHHGIAARFGTLQTADRHPSKPHPSMIAAALDETAADADSAVMIGDTGFDMTMARAAGVRALGVAWGYHSVDLLTAAGAHAIAADPGDLIGLAA